MKLFFEKLPKIPIPAANDSMLLMKTIRVEKMFINFSIAMEKNMQVKA